MGPQLREVNNEQEFVCLSRQGDYEKTLTAGGHRQPDASTAARIPGQQRGAYFCLNLRASQWPAGEPVTSIRGPSGLMTSTNTGHGVNSVSDRRSKWLS